MAVRCVAEVITERMCMCVLVMKCKTAEENVLAFQRVTSERVCREKSLDSIEFPPNLFNSSRLH